MHGTTKKWRQISLRGGTEGTENEESKSRGSCPTRPREQGRRELRCDKTAGAGEAAWRDSATSAGDESDAYTWWAWSVRVFMRFRALYETDAPVVWCEGVCGATW